MRFEINNDQMRSFQNEGYLHLSNVLTPSQLSAWNDYATHLEIENTKSDEPFYPNAAVFGDRNKKLMRQNDLHGINTELTLDLLSSPFWLAIAREFFGEGAIPLQMDMFYKREGRQYEVMWHRDVLYMKANRFINVGVYLDDSNAGDGCFRYVPNSHKEYSNKNTSNWMEITAKAGDVIIHDMRLLHSSPEKQTSGARKTIYIEMSSVRDVLLEGHNSTNWTEARSRWMGLILQRALNDHWHSSWEGGYPLILSDPTIEFAKLVESSEEPIPASYI